MHPIKIEILQKLTSNIKLRFSQFGIENVEMDLFNYHLKHLVKNGFIIKCKEGYTISSIGKKFVAEIYPLGSDGKRQSVYKVNILTGALREIEGKRELLLQKRLRHPFYQNISILGGNMHKGEDILKGAERIFKERTSLNGKFIHIGICRKIMYSNKSLFSDLFYLICFTFNPTGRLIIKNKYGENIWLSVKDAINKESKISFLKNIYSDLEHKTPNKIPFFFNVIRQNVKP